MQAKMIAMLEGSLSERKGVTLFFHGQSIPMVVTEVIGTEAVLGKNQEFSEILVRLDQVEACAMG